MANIPEIRLPSETVAEISGIAITNSLIATFTVSVILIVLAILIRRKAGIVPSRLQLAFEAVFEFFLQGLTSAFGSEEKARRALPYIMTLFLMLFISNQFGLIPLLSSIVINGETNVFRTPTSDINLPLSMALISIISAHLIALSISPLKHIGNFIKIAPLFKARSIGDFANALLEIFLGILDIVGEFAKIISLSARLFGNIFAGDVMVAIISGLAVFTQFLVPIPFIVIGIFSSLVHAFVFPMLIMQFAAGTINSVSSQNNS